MRRYFFNHYILMLALLLTIGPASLLSAPVVLPREQATHFCQLLINDGNSVSPLSVHARRLMVPNDSLTAEQLFTAYLFQQDNWQMLRIFPHLADDGTVNWYAPADELTASLDTEHQKYIREVLPRLQQEIMAGHWETVDACIDRMIQYQCQFGSSDSRPQPQSTAIILIFLAFAALFIGSLLVVQRKKYWKLHISQ